MDKEKIKDLENILYAFRLNEKAHTAINELLFTERKSLLLSATL